ncbi:uncharacterized protein TNCV_341151 [Trichonephila clavipes]|uniref:Uncharacterized protein n=1 Tax=Trichonephila clavipes TaxID=2585209 RepID=A0A8X6SPS9_TRICX|nr:uncharacterized protein TNCV_341151 [Trichonephila clavipes]
MDVLTYNILLASKIATSERRRATDKKLQKEGGVICKRLAFQRYQTKHSPVVTSTKCLNEEIVQPVSRSRIAHFNIVTWALMDRSATSQAPRMGTVCKINSVCMNSSTTCAAAWTFNSETMPAATIDAASDTKASLMYQDGRIRVRGHRGKGTLAARIRHRHIGPTPGIMVWTAIGYMCRSYLVRIDGTLNTKRYVSEVLCPMTLPFI